jgi:dihydrofolate reductase
MSRQGIATIAAIAALAANRVIGDGDRLPWHLPEDLARFKRLTMGGTLILGRKTWESIGRPLPGRRMVVVTRQPVYAPEGVTVARSIAEALERAGEGSVWIAGGADIYRQALDRCLRLYLTRIEADFPGDAFFPEIDADAWRLVEEERREAGERAPFGYRFETWERRELPPPERI